MYVAFELGKQSWKLAMTSGFGVAPVVKTVAGGDWGAVEPSVRAQARLREKLRTLTRASAKHSLVETVRRVNTLLRGWRSYFRYGYPRRVFRTTNHYVRVRFRCFLRNRSQRRSRPFRQGESLYAGLQRYGLQYL